MITNLYHLSKASAIEDIKKNQEDIENKAALEIQRMMKRWKARQKNSKIKEEKIAKATTVIVTAFKGFLSKQQLKKAKLQIDTIPEVEENDDSDIEEKFKKIENFEKNEKIEKNENHENLEKIEQNSDSDEKPTKTNLKKFRNFNENIIMLQSNIRRFLAQRKYKKSIHSIIKLQAKVRMWLVRRIFKDIKEAIIFIQSSYRGYKSRKSTKKPLL